MPRRGENIYKRKDGRYEGRYVIGRTPEGKTLFGYVYGKQYMPVRRELMRKKAEFSGNRGANAPAAMTLGQWMEQRVLRELAGRVKPSSLQTYQRMYARHIKNELGAMDIGAIRPADIQAFLAQLAQNGLSASTRKSVLRMVGAGMALAAEEGVILKNPCAKIRVNSERTEQRVLTADEQAKLHRAAMAGGEAQVLLGLYAGMRLGEVCALRWEDVDFQLRTISVRRTVQRISQGEGRTALSITSPKSASSRRTIPAPDFLLDLLAQRREMSASPYVFGTGEQPAEPRTMQRRFSHLAASLSLSGVHFHTLRHTFATRMLEIGVDMKTVSVLLGHSSTNVTLHFYAHSTLDHQRRAISLLTQDLK